MTISLEITLAARRQDSSTPSALAAPVVSGPTGLGDSLQTTNGQWAGGGLTFTYQWQRDGVDIAGATAPTYVLTIADDNAWLGCVVSATNNLGAASSVSNAVQADDLVAPVLNGSPSISGLEQVGRILSAAAVTSTGNPTPWRGWQWRRNGIDISGATAADYQLSPADAGQTITVVQTATNAMGSASAESAATGAIQNSNDLVPPVVTTLGYNAPGRVLNLELTEQDSLPITIHWALVQSPSTPSGAQIKAGTGGGILQAGTFPAVNGLSNTTISVSDQTGNEIHLLATDGAGNDSPVAVAAGVVVDSTAPVLSLPQDVETGAGSADWSVTSNEAGGTIFAAARLATSPRLTHAEIEGGGGNAVATSTDPSPTADNANQGSLSGLSPATFYLTDMFHRDAYGNESAIVSGDGFTTAAGGVLLERGFAAATALNATLIDVTLPAGILAGDLITAYVCLSQGIGRTLLTPAGWTLETFWTNPSGGTWPVAAIFSRIADGSEGSFVTVSVTGGAVDMTCYAMAHANASGLLVATSALFAPVTASNPTQTVPAGALLYNQWTTSNNDIISLPGGGTQMVLDNTQQTKLGVKRISGHGGGVTASTTATASSGSAWITSQVAILP